jgi:hypothetical protein
MSDWRHGLRRALLIASTPPEIGKRLAQAIDPNKK